VFENISREARGRFLSAEVDAVNLERSRAGPRLGLRWQAERDTAFARTLGSVNSNAFRPPDSAVVAALCRRTLKPRGPGISFCGDPSLRSVGQE